jgi:alpha/beta superfamily hydrolase
MENCKSLLEPAGNACMAPRVFREPIYIPSGQDYLFAWHHSGEHTLRNDSVAVICGPVGYEYAHSHRSIRHLADQLAMHGVPAFRFDYHGVGDSSGDGAGPNGLQRWKTDIAQVIQFARERSGRKRICLIGIRFGATLAALVASDIRVDFLVLWSPCISGRQFIRELKALATGGDSSSMAQPAILESGGLAFSPDMAADIQAIDLRNLHLLPETSVLVIGRDDLSPDRSLSDRLTGAGITNDFVALPGFAGMMREPQQSDVPHVALLAIVEWLSRQDPLRYPTVSAQSNLLLPASPPTIEILDDDRLDRNVRILERLCQFGTGSHLFGILTQPAIANERPVVIMFNAGCQHHAGPNRLYVSLARALAQAGFASLRFDLEGIGDSILRGDGRENHAYPTNAGADALAAITYLADHHGFNRFAAIGLCSGAHTAFHVGLDVENYAIADLILINPLTFHWVEGMSLETTRQNFEVVRYKKSVWEGRSWLKLLKGEVNMFNLFRVATTYMMSTIKSHYNSVRELLSLYSTPLSQELKKLFRLNRSITLLIAEGDPGYDILLAGARRTTMKGIKTGHVGITIIPDADHTFSPFKSRELLISKVVSQLRSKYG